jgi:hypothetical protein
MLKVVSMLKGEELEQDLNTVPALLSALDSFKAQKKKIRWRKISDY